MSVVVTSGVSAELRANRLEALSQITERPPLRYADGQQVTGAFAHSPVNGVGVVQSATHGETCASENLYRVRDERGVLHLLLESQVNLVSGAT